MSRKRRALKPTYRETNMNGPALKRQKVSFYQDNIDSSLSSSYNNHNSTFTTNPISHSIQNPTNIAFHDLYQFRINNNNNTNSISTFLTSLPPLHHTSTSVNNSSSNSMPSLISANNVIEPSSSPANKASNSYIGIIKSQLGDTGASDVMWVLLHYAPEIESSLKRDKLYSKVTTSTNQAASFLSSLMVTQPKYTPIMKLIVQELKHRLDARIERKTKDIEKLRSMLGDVMARNVTKIFFHQRPEFKKWAEAQEWTQVITKSTTHAEIFLSCLIRLAPAMTPYIKVLIEQLAQIMVIQCVECEKKGQLKLSLYKAKKNTEEWFWFMDDLMCKDCYEGSEYQIVNILKKCGLIKKLDVPHDLVMMIGDLSKGMIVECVLCGESGNVNRKEFESKNDTKEWKFCKNYSCVYGDGNVVCNECFGRRLCTLCEVNIDEYNEKCETCDHVICAECEDMGRHRELHYEMCFSLPPL